MPLDAVTYFALKPLLVGDGDRSVGDLVPEARDWPALAGHISDGKLAPVLVATLPKAARDFLAEWTEEQDMIKQIVAEDAAKFAAEQADRRRKLDSEFQAKLDGTQTVSPYVPLSVSTPVLPPLSYIPPASEEEMATIGKHTADPEDDPADLSGDTQIKETVA